MLNYSICSTIILTNRYTCISIVQAWGYVDICRAHTGSVYIFNHTSCIVQRGGDKLGYEAEAFAIYDTMRYIKPPVYTICVGNAFGEAAMLLAAGKEGNRAALPSASIMLRQPMQRFTQMQASDIDIYRNEIRKTNTNVVNLLSKHIGHPVEKISKDILRPRYFNPYEAVEYGIIDNVLEPDDEAFKNLVRAQSQL